jgi:hypothetical protein
MTQLIGYDFDNISNILSTLKFIPHDYNLVKKILTSFSNLHYSGGILYDLTNSRVHELRGESYHNKFNVAESSELLTLAGAIAEEKTIMLLLHNEYVKYLRQRKKGTKLYHSLSAFVKDIFDCPRKLGELKLTASRNRTKNYLQDIEELLMIHDNIIPGVQIYSKALIFSNLFQCYLDRHTRRPKLPQSLFTMSGSGCKRSFVSTIIDDIPYFGVPIFFFRFSLTSR